MLMTKKIVLGIVMACCVTGLQAQSLESSGSRAGLDRRSVDVLAAGSPGDSMDWFDAGEWAELKKSGVTEESVGDPYSFGRKKTYLGVAQTEWLTLQEGPCGPYVPGEGRCVQVEPAPDQTFVNETDLAVIELPKKATKSILCFTFTPFATWQWENYTGGQQLAWMSLNPTVRIESEVLDDPSLIDPGTGLPFNGVLLDQPISTFWERRTLGADESDFRRQIMTRTCTAGLVNVRSLRDGYGLSDAVIKDFFKKPITVTFGVQGTVSMMTYADYSVGIRLYGD